MSSRKSRRKFIQQLGTASLLLSANSFPVLSGETPRPANPIEANPVEANPIEANPVEAKPIAANDKIRMASIGMGIMGYNDVGAAIRVPGVEWAAACDLYTGRLQRAKELNKDLFTTKDCREILDRKDIDAVIIATSDNWHARIATEALAKGKAVYCEKPMVHRVSEGLPLIEARDKSGRPMQVGSQRVSSVAYAKARDIYKAGEIGQLTCIEASFDRQSALGAWEYTLPTDAGAATVDWDRYIAGTERQPYDGKKFFWWRNYRAFGTGVAGDLFVHLLSGIHFITGSKGPARIFSTGQIAYWKDGRDVPDVMTAIMHYPDTAEHPAFELTLRVNFISGQGETSTVKFYGSEGVLDMGYNGFTIHHRKMPKAPGIGGWDSLGTYPKAMQEELLRQYSERWPADQREPGTPAPTVYQLPAGYDEHYEHLANFFNSVRSGSPVVEDPVFGFRAAAPCLLANESYFSNRVIDWDPVAMKLKA
jgi:predicted dehydrogenase